MKNNPIKKLSTLVCIVFMLLLLCSCVGADIVISGSADKSSATSMNCNDTTALIVNISTGTFHLDENCRYVLKTKEENKKIIFYPDVQTAMEDGYTPCSVCTGEYEN
jgi:hypothetical protein